MSKKILLVSIFALSLLSVHSEYSESCTSVSDCGEYTCDLNGACESTCASLDTTTCPANCDNKYTCVAIENAQCSSFAEEAKCLGTCQWLGQCQDENGTVLDGETFASCGYDYGVWTYGNKSCKVEGVEINIGNIDTEETCKTIFPSNVNWEKGCVMDGLIFDNISESQCQQIKFKEEKIESSDFDGSNYYIKEGYYCEYFDNNGYNSIDADTDKASCLQKNGGKWKRFGTCLDDGIDAYESCSNWLNAVCQISKNATKKAATKELCEGGNIPGIWYEGFCFSGSNGFKYFERTTIVDCFGKWKKCRTVDEKSEYDFYAETNCSSIEPFYTNGACILSWTWLIPGITEENCKAEKLSPVWTDGTGDSCSIPGISERSKCRRTLKKENYWTESECKENSNELLCSELAIADCLGNCEKKLISGCADKDVCGTLAKWQCKDGCSWNVKTCTLNCEKAYDEEDCLSNKQCAWDNEDGICREKIGSDEEKEDEEVDDPDGKTDLSGAEMDRATMFSLLILLCIFL